MAIARQLLAALLWSVCAAAESDLHTAVKAGDHRLAEKLLAGGASPGERDDLGGTPLHDAAWAGDLEMVKILIAHGAPVNARHREAGSTPLHYAIITNHREVVLWLLDHGADLKTTYQAGSTPLHLAANRGYAGIVQLLLERGADPAVRDQSGANALDEAALKGQAAVVKLLLGRGSKPSPGTMVQAVEKGHAEVVRLLLDGGASGESKDTGGQTLLTLALQYRQRAVVELLLAKGARLAEPQRTQALRNAVLRGDADIVDLLIRTPNEATLLLSDAALKGHIAVVRLLLDRGASVKALNSSGTTALHDAALGGHEAVAELLLDRGADVNAVDTASANTPLHVAASYGRKNVALLLLDRGAGVKRKNRMGKTARDLALEAGQTELAELLATLERQN